MRLSLPLEFKTFFGGERIFENVFKTQGKVFREHKNRKTLLFQKDGKGFFLKIHRGIGIREVIKSLTSFRFPVISIMNEVKAVHVISGIGIDTMRIVGYGVRGIPPAWMESFLITEELVNTVSLETFCKTWKEDPPDFKLKLAIIKKVAEITKSMHRSGINHRDLYICHFLLDLNSIKDDLNLLKIYLIDLHRVQIRKKVPERWIIKDLSGLLFSSIDIGLSRRDLFRFMKLYSDKPLRSIFKNELGFWMRVYKKAISLYKRHSDAFADLEFYWQRGLKDDV